MKAFSFIKKLNVFAAALCLLIALPGPAVSYQIKSDEVRVNTAPFSGNLSDADNTVQKALQTLDQLIASGIIKWNELTDPDGNQTLNFSGFNTTWNNVGIVLFSGYTRWVIDSDDSACALFEQDGVHDNLFLVDCESGQVSVGKMIYYPSATQNITAAGNSILANATTVVVNPNGDYTLTSAPTIANGITGQVLDIICANAEANTVTLQDQDTLANSNLQLGAATRAISGKDILRLKFDGTDWIEMSYSNN